MRINEKSAEPARAEGVRGTHPAGVAGPAGEPVRPVAPGSRADRVQISEAGRELAARANPEAELTPARIAEVRRRVLEGAYGSAEVVGQVALRILQRGAV